MPEDIITGPTDEYVEMLDLVTVNGGRVTPEQVVERAADPSSTFHKHFEWNDTEAARRFRLQQAGGLLRKFKVVQSSGGRTIKVDAFIRINDSTDGYAPVREAITMDWVVAQKRIRLIATMERLAQELSQWDEFTAVAEAITDALATN